MASKKSKKEIYKELSKKIESQIVSDLNSGSGTKKIDVFGEQKFGFVKNHFTRNFDFDIYGDRSDYAKKLTDEIYERLHLRPTEHAANYVIKTKQNSSGLSLGSDGLYTFLNKLIS
jgi:hypothetical protein